MSTARISPRKSARNSQSATRPGARVVASLSPTEQVVGTVRYVGPASFSIGIWCGVELDQPLGKNDGSIKGERYFQCPPNHGIFCRAGALQHIQTGPIDDAKHHAGQVLSPVPGEVSPDRQLTQVDKADEPRPTINLEAFLQQVHESPQIEGSRSPAVPVETKGRLSASGVPPEIRDCSSTSGNRAAETEYQTKARRQLAEAIEDRSLVEIQKSLHFATMVGVDSKEMYHAMRIADNLEAEYKSDLMEACAHMFNEFETFLSEAVDTIKADVEDVRLCVRDYQEAAGKNPEEGIAMQSELARMRSSIVEASENSTIVRSELLGALEDQKKSLIAMSGELAEQSRAQSRLGGNPDDFVGKELAILQSTVLQTLEEQRAAQEKHVEDVFKKELVGIRSAIQAVAAQQREPVEPSRIPSEDVHSIEKLAAELEGMRSIVLGTMTDLRTGQESLVKDVQSLQGNPELSTLRQEVTSMRLSTLGAVEEQKQIQLRFVEEAQKSPVASADQHKELINQVASLLGVLEHQKEAQSELQEQSKRMLGAVEEQKQMQLKLVEEAQKSSISSAEHKELIEKATNLLGVLEHQNNIQGTPPDALQSLPALASIREDVANMRLAVLGAVQDQNSRILGAVEEQKQMQLKFVEEARRSPAASADQHKELMDKATNLLGVLEHQNDTQGALPDANKNSPDLTSIQEEIVSMRLSVLGGVEELKQMQPRLVEDGQSIPAASADQNKEVSDQLSNLLGVLDRQNRIYDEGKGGHQNLAELSTLKEELVNTRLAMLGAVREQKQMLLKFFEDAQQSPTASSDEAKDIQQSLTALAAMKDELANMRLAMLGGFEEQRQARVCVSVQGDLQSQLAVASPTEVASSPSGEPIEEQPKTQQACSEELPMSLDKDETPTAAEASDAAGPAQEQQQGAATDQKPAEGARSRNTSRSRKQNAGLGFTALGTTFAWALSK